MLAPAESSEGSGTTSTTWGALPFVGWPSVLRRKLAVWLLAAGAIRSCLMAPLRLGTTAP
jgi:hypothetical protein